MEKTDPAQSRSRLALSADVAWDKDRLGVEMMALRFLAAEPA